MPGFFEIVIVLAIICVFVAGAVLLFRAGTKK